MKIVDVNPFFYPFEGGIEHRMHDTSRLLAERGHDVTVLTGRLKETPEEESRDGYHILRLKSKMIDIYNPPFISSEGVLEAIESLNPDVVNYNYRWAPSYNKDLKRYDGKKVFTYHNVWGEGTGVVSKVSEMNDNKFRDCLDTFDHIIAVSDYVRNDLISRGYSADHVTSIPTGLSSYPESPGKGDGEYILSLGRLVRTKGLDYLVEAMQDVDCKLIICGKGPDMDRIKKQIKKLDLEDKIEIKGWVDDDEKKRLMSSCKMFVMPSLFESLGLAAIEQLSYGRPIICTNVNGLPDTVKNGGIIIPPKDPVSLSKEINRLLEDESLREEVGRNATVQAERYRWDDLITDIENVYNKVLNS